MSTRRSFLSELATLAAGAIVAPTLAETLAVNAKKYFFLRGNPLTYGGIPIYESPGMAVNSIYGLPYWVIPSDTSLWWGLSRDVDPGCLKMPEGY